MRALALALLLLLPLASAGAAALPQGDLIVTFREGAAPPDALLVLPALVHRDASLADAAAWARDARVERVDWARPLEAHMATLPSSAHLGLTRADALQLTGAGVTVAVVDSGIDAAHPDLAGRVRANVRLVEGRFLDAPGDADGHGTHVAGIVASSGASSQGRHRGLAPDAHLVGVDISGRFTTASALLAYDWLARHHEEHGIRVVVNAWGRVEDGARFDPRDPTVRAIDRLVERGVVVLFSASNHGPGPSTLSVEAMDPRVITVGATDAAGLLADYSSRGPVPGEAWVKPDVVAPGDRVVGPRSAGAPADADDPDALHAVYSGTSQAVPHVAGIVAMMLQADPMLSPADVQRALRESAIDLGVPGPDDATGYGLVDAVDAFRVSRGLEPDRQNPLVAGGERRHEDAAPLAPTRTRGLLALAARPDVVWETAFPVMGGARELSIRVDAQGAQGVSLELAREGALVDASDGPATRIDTPEPGIWVLRVRADVPLATSARLEASTLLPANATRALAYDGRDAAPLPALPPERALDARAVAPWAAMGLATILFAVALWPRRPRSGS